MTSPARHEGLTVAITGGAGGIGQALVCALAQRPDVSTVHATYHHREPGCDEQGICWHQLDLANETEVADWTESLGELDWLINAAGLLHRPGQGPEKSIRHLDPDFFMDNIQANTLPSLLLAKHASSNFRHGRPAIFAAISAKVGSIEDNRLGGWVSYRASKAALNMCLKTVAIEWSRTLPNVAVAALHPGTTDTALSRPFQRHVPAGQLFNPAQTASYLLEVLDRLGPEDSGKFWAFDGELLPW